MIDNILLNHAKNLAKQNEDAMKLVSQLKSEIEEQKKELTSEQLEETDLSEIEKLEKELNKRTKAIHDKLKNLK